MEIAGGAGAVKKKNRLSLNCPVGGKYVQCRLRGLGEIETGGLLCDFHHNATWALGLCGVISHAWSSGMFCPFAQPLP